MASIKYLKYLTEYPSLLVSGVAQGAIKEIEKLEKENDILRQQIQWAIDKLGSKIEQQ